MQKFKPSLITAALVTSGLVFASQPLYAQEAPQPDVEVPVEGDIQSLNQKRFGDTVSEQLSADDLGGLPDVSMADALTRLPGISAVRTGGQAAEINIRGLSGGFVFSTLNGREQVSTSGTRSIEFDQYPSELINSAAVYKSPKASLIEGGVAGTVELRTASPLSNDQDHTFNVNVRGMFNDRADEVPDGEEFGHRLSFSYQGKFMDDTLGVALSYARLYQPSTAVQFIGLAYNDRVDADGIYTPGQCRMEEFEALIERTHKHGMQVLIDIVPNHVARGYQSLSAPEGVTDFGANDDVSVEYKRDNNFYYVVGKDFKVPDAGQSYQPLGGDSHRLADGLFDESPAKWTGNGARVAQPSATDWYETVKVNYGVKPDGGYDFPTLPKEFKQRDYRQHHTFWQDKDLPDSWLKFRDIAHYWLGKGVDGFRYDMAEMVPVEFWSYLNASIKMKNPDAFLLAEVYQPDLYRDYIQLGKMDYLYDKVEFYDTLKTIMQGTGDTIDLVNIQESLRDIEPHMLHFLENHDEQRIASPNFAGSADKGKPALVVSALISRSPTMLYFGQDVGEDGSEETGFGDPSRTTIFDYAGVPAHQRWMNDGKFDGGQLNENEAALRKFYISVMNISATHPAMRGDFVSLHRTNLEKSLGYSEYDNKTLAFARVNGAHKVIVVSQFTNAEKRIRLSIPTEEIKNWGLNADQTEIKDLITGVLYSLKLDQRGGSIDLTLSPFGSVVLELQYGN